MSAKKRAGNQAARPDGDVRRPKDDFRSAPPPPAGDPAAARKKAILTWILFVLLGAVLLGAVYKKFFWKKNVPTIPPAPKLVEKEWTSAVDGDRMWASLKRFLDLGPRVPDTEGSTRARAMIRAELEAAGLTDIRDQSFTEKTPKTDKKFTNVIGVLPGKRPEGIAIAAHYDTKLFEDFRFVGANDAASAVTVLFELARKLKPGTRDLTYYFVFFDGEEAFLFDWNQWETETGNKDNTYGSRYFVRRMEEDKFPVKALVLLDLVGDKDYSLVEDQKFSKELMAIFKNASREVFGVDFFIQNRPIGDDHDPFLEAGIPAIDLIDFEYGPNGNLDYWHTPEDTIDKLSQRSLERTGTMVLKALPEVEAMVLKGLAATTSSTPAPPPPPLPGSPGPEPTTKPGPDTKPPK